MNLVVKKACGIVLVWHAWCGSLLLIQPVLIQPVLIQPVLIQPVLGPGGAGCGLRAAGYGLRAVWVAWVADVRAVRAVRVGCVPERQPLCLLAKRRRDAEEILAGYNTGDVMVLAVMRDA